MRIIDRYIARDFLITFAFTLGILTFVMSAAGMVKLIDLLSRGVSGGFLLRMFLNNIPYMLMFSIPMSTLASALLIMGKLSADGEITAMKACGVNLWQVASPVILLSIGLSFLCLYVSAKVAPERRHAQRLMVKEVKVETAISLLDEGTWVRDFPGLLIYIGGKKGLTLQDVVVFQTESGSEHTTVRAKRGVIRPESEEIVYIDLYDVRIYRPNPEHSRDPSKGNYIAAGFYTERLDLSKSRSGGPSKKKLSDTTLRELMVDLRNVHDLASTLDREGYLKLKTSILVESNQRVALSMSCFAFTLLAIPLGLKSRRKESSVGIAISLAIIFAFYFFIILAESLVNHPALRPELITWFPVFLTQGIGGFLIQRNR